MRQFNAKQSKICAFCKHWYDPTNEAITPKVGDWWNVDENAKKRCMKTLSIQHRSTDRCMEFQSKL